MNSLAETVIDRCLRLSSEIHNRGVSDKETLLYHYVEKRLSKSFTAYEDELDGGVQYLCRCRGVNVMKKLNKL
jgi:hypothetical protein